MFVEPEIFQRTPHLLPAGAVAATLQLARLRSDVEYFPLPPELQRAIGKRQRGFIGGRLCAARALELAGAEPVILARETVSGAPIWPQPLLGSITHSDHLATAVVIDGQGKRGIGIDSEPLLRESACRAVVKLCCSDSERRTHLDAGSVVRAATVIWTIKEAFFKAAYRSVGRSIGFHEIIVEHIDWSRNQALLEPALALGIAACTADFVIDADGVHASLVLLE